MLYINDKINFMQIREKLKLWFEIGRGFTTPLSVLPYVFAVVLAAKHYKTDFFLSFLGLIGIFLAHLSVNMLDDYFDWKKGAVETYKNLEKQGLVPENNKCFYFTQNLVTPKSVFIVSSLMAVIAFLIGIFIASKVGISVIIIALITALLGFFYSASPVKLSYRGLGEPVIALIFGPLLMTGAYLTAGAHLDKFILVISAITGLLVMNIGYVHAVSDFDSDLKVGKKSFPGLFKTRDNAIFVLALIYIFAYVLLSYGVFAKIFPIAALATFILLPKIFALVNLMKNSDIEPKWWMGALENWEQVKKQGAEWFMLRICLTRNIVTDFVIIFSIAYYLFGG